MLTSSGLKLWVELGSTKITVKKPICYKIACGFINLYF